MYPKNLVPYLSEIKPQKTPKKAAPKDAIVYKNDVLALDQSNSLDRGLRNAEIEPIIPKDKALNIKTAKTITQP
tara:strand:+ start:217 stop:438 length:222 start_codon:yes stop_codon:yes gene_type:complete